MIGVLDAWLPAYSDRKEFWTLDGGIIRWVGVLLYVAGGALRMWPVFVLGHRFSGLVAIQPGHTLVTGGIYSVIRHPSYLGLLVNSLGWGLVFRSVAGVLLDSDHDRADPRAYPRGGGSAALAVRHGVQCLPQPYVTPDSGALLIVY